MGNCDLCGCLGFDVEKCACAVWVRGHATFSGSLSLWLLCPLDCGQAVGGPGAGSSFVTKVKQTVLGFADFKDVYSCNLYRFRRQK